MSCGDHHDLNAALGEVALKAGVESILGNFDAAMLRLYRRVGVEDLALVAIAQAVAIAILVAVHPAAAVDGMRGRGGDGSDQQRSCKQQHHRP